MLEFNKLKLRENSNLTSKKIDVIKTHNWKPRLLYYCTYKCTICHLNLQVDIESNSNELVRVAMLVGGIHFEIKNLTCNQYLIEKVML